MGFFSNLFGSKKISLPEAPSWWSDPNLDWSQSQLKGQVPGLLGLLTSGPNALPSLLQETIQTNPMVSQLAIQSLKSQLEPDYRTSRQDLVNTLEANNQLTGSTTGNTLQNFENDYLAKLTSVGAQYGLADIERALNNRIGLYGTGLNTAQAVGQLALSNQGQRNQFNLGNYENQVAGVLASQPDTQGGLSGALTGAIGGGLAGSAFGGYGILAGALLGGASGAMGSSTTGGNLLTAGAGLYGNSRQNNLLSKYLTGLTGLSTPSSTSSVFSGEEIANKLYNNTTSNTLNRWMMN